MIPDYSGKRLAERYLLRRRIGFGGMATVYEAVDSELNKPVAVKILNPHYAGQSDYLQRFRQEAREAARIRHENLVDVTDQGSAEGLAFFVMEFLRGETLQGYLHPSESESRPVPWRDMVLIVAQVCDALQHAHEHGVIHRDIKPGNIFLMSRRSGGFRVKVLDLGIAKVLQGHRDPTAPPTTRASQGTPGTPEYMSPEQVRGQPEASPQTDLYSVGVMMYRMLTGTLPFYSELSPYDVMDQHCKQAPEPPRKRAPSQEIPEQLEREVMRALAKRPEDRQASAQELADSLRALDAVEARRERTLREDDEARTLQYRFNTLPPQRTLARMLSYVAASLSGMTLSTTLFMVLVLLPFIASQADAPRRRPFATADDSLARIAKEPSPAPAPNKQGQDASSAPKQPDVASVLPKDTAISASPAPPAPAVAEPLRLDVPGDPPRPVEQNVDATPPPVSAPPPIPTLTPEKALAKFLASKRRLMRTKCGDYKLFTEENFSVRFELAVTSGPPVAVEIAGRRKDTPLGVCLTEMLRKLPFPPFATTSFRSVAITF